MDTMQFCRVEGQHADLMIFPSIADHLAPAGKEDKVVGAVPLFDDIWDFIDFAS